MTDLDNASAASASAEDIVYGHGETVLLVDSNKNLLRLGKTLLEKLNYQAVTARDGEELLTLCEKLQGDIDLLILDSFTTKIERRELLQKLAKMLPQAKAIFSSVNDRKIGIECCCDKFLPDTILQKPYSVSGFSRAIHEALT